MCGVFSPQRRRKVIISDFNAKLFGNIPCPGRLLDVACGSYDNCL